MKKIEKNRTKPGNPYYLVLFENRTKPGTVLSGDSLYMTKQGIAGPLNGTM